MDARQATAKIKQAMGKADWRGVDSEIAISCYVTDGRSYRLVVENEFAYCVHPSQLLSNSVTYG